MVGARVRGAYGMLAGRSAAAPGAPEPACSSRIPGLQLEAALPVPGASQAVAAGARRLNEGGALFLWTALGARSIALPAWCMRVR